MKEEILSNLENAAGLEDLYQSNPKKFKTAFDEIYPDIEDRSVAQFWHARLHFETEKTSISWGNHEDLIFTIFACFLAGILAKFPQIFDVSEETYYPRNIGFIVLPFLTLYFSWKNNLNIKLLALILFSIIGSAFFINLFPKGFLLERRTFILSCIHLPLFLWSVTGLAFAGKKWRNNEARIGYLRYNGELIVLSVLIVIAGVILTGLTFGLFELLGKNVWKWYMEYVVIIGLAASPIVANLAIRTNPQLVNKVSPVIAKIFSPLVLITLVVYLGAIIQVGKSPYTDREFLLTFNGLLIGVIAIIFFSVIEISRNQRMRWESIVLSLLSSITVIINGIALSAILFRIFDYGITANRLAVLGANILFFIHLIIITYRLVKSVNNAHEIDSVKTSIAKYLPIYSAWTVVVTFIFPLIFGFK